MNVMKLRLRWSEVISHVPCGGSPSDPAGQLLISAKLTEIDGVGNTLGQVGNAVVRQTDGRMILGGVRNSRHFEGGLFKWRFRTCWTPMCITRCPQIITTTTCPLLHARAFWLGSDCRHRRALRPYGMVAEESATRGPWISTSPTSLAWSNRERWRV